LSDIYSLSHPLVDEFSKLAQESETVVDVPFCADVVLKALRKTTYTVKARSVSLAVGFCTYAARLVESIGVKEHYLYSLPGKGIAIHKILALAAPTIFEDYIRKSIWSNIEFIEYVNYALEIVKSYDYSSETSDSDNREILYKAITMLQNFVQVLRLAAQRLYLSFEKCRAIPENYFVDFDLHISGVPDLIIECDSSRPRALVIEWKTYGESPHEWEKVQAYTYALLEARRLGYGTLRGTSIRLADLQTFFRAIADDNPNSVAVIPIIIRSNGFYSNHPAFPSEHVKHVLRVNEIEELLKKIVIAAAHLTLLRSAIPEYIKDEVSNLCRVKIKGYEGVLHRWTPRILDKHGSPGNRSESSICDLCSKIHPIIYNVCPLFFGKGPSKDVLDKVFWDLRFKIYRIHERALAPLKAIQDIRIEYIEEALEYGASIKYYIDRREYELEKKQKGPKLMIYHENLHEKPLETRLDLFDKIELIFPKILSPKHMKLKNIREHAGEIPYLKFKRKMRQYERKFIIEQGFEEPLIRIWTLRRGKPVLVFFEDGTSRRSSLSFSISLFGRVENVYTEDDHAVVDIRPISNAFKFQFLTVSNIVHYHNLNRAVALEANVDLTHLELQALVALQKAIKDASSMLANNVDINKDVETLQETLRKNKRNLIDLLSNVFSIVRGS